MSLPSSHTSNNTSTFYNSAPLPSPANTAPQHFFFPPPSSQRQTQPATANQGSYAGQYLPPHSLQQQQENPVSQQQQARAPSLEQEAIPSSQDPSSPLRREFGLLAEAAKRAQVAVITRDLGEVGL